MVESISKNLGDLEIHKKPLVHYVEPLKCYVYISNLQVENEIKGYLYIFQKSLYEGNLEDQLFQKLCKENLGLDVFLDDLNRKFITKSLYKNKKNISHTAAFLQMKRSTLNTRMMKLKINNSTDSIVVPRIRTKKDKNKPNVAVSKNKKVDTKRKRSKKLKELPQKIIVK